MIVFKFPGNAKQNYIKRLVGLPGETIWIRHGDIFVEQPGTSERRIARKPPDKLRHMLQLVHDTQYDVAASWSQWVGPYTGSRRRGRRVGRRRRYGNTYRCEARDAARDRSAIAIICWTLRHGNRSNRRPPREALPLPATAKPQPILSPTSTPTTRTRRVPFDRTVAGLDYPDCMGLNWVGDLAVECELEVLSDSGELELDLVEAGRHHRCRFDLATGMATMSIDDGQMNSSQDDQQEVDGASEVTAATPIRGKGSYSVRFSNIDDQLLVVGGWHRLQLRPCDDLSVAGRIERPATSATDPGDSGAGRTDGTSCSIASQSVARAARYLLHCHRSQNGRVRRITACEIRDIILSGCLTDPRTWIGCENNLFDRRQEADFPLKEDQFFPLGDNSPYSRDGRLWGVEMSAFVNGHNEAGRADSSRGSRSVDRQGSPDLLASPVACSHCR